MSTDALLLLALVAGAVASLVISPLVVRVAHRVRCLDHPGGRRVHTRPVPRLGGVAVFAATVIGLGVAGLAHGSNLAAYSGFVGGILVGGAVLFVTGVLDDLRGLSPRTKLLAQLLAATVAYAFGFRIEMVSLGHLTDVSLGWLALPVTLLWIVGVTNAFNLIDGLDGLATGIASVALATVTGVALLMGRPEVAVTAAVLLGALLGFLRYNFNPARIFLGDSGSLFVGFMLAVLSVHGSTKSSTAVLAIVPLLALGLPLADTVLAMARRWLRGVAFSCPDGRHIHHRLLAAGLTQRRAVAVLYVVSASLGAVGLLAAFAPPEGVLIVTAAGTALVLLLLVAGLRGLDYHEFSEVGAVIAIAPAKFRRVMRDRIHARDVAQVLERAESLEAVNAILADNTDHFGFARMEVRHQEGVTRTSGDGALPCPRQWWTVRPLAESGGAASLALVIWCDGGASSRPWGVDRVAAILVPALAERMADPRVLRTLPARPQRERHSGVRPQLEAV
jgi:UDP-GlcNAc:undecaprenyl-phosphate/decaprenyl-phosphate GlcNAc-1-phosphate transferase